MKIVLRAMAEIFEVLDVEIVDREPHTQIFGANSHFVLLQTFPSSFPRKREPRAARTGRSPGPPLGRRERLAEMLAPVGPQGPPARRSARLATVAARARGSLLWTTGTSCDCACNRRSFKKETACHSRAPSRQSSGTKHFRRDRTPAPRRRPATRKSRLTRCPNCAN